MSSHVDPHQTLGFAVKRLQQALRAKMDGALAEFGLTAPQYAVLALLADDPGISNAELARRSFVTPPTMIRIVTTLEETGLIIRGDHPVEGRVKRAELTPDGRAQLAAAAGKVQKWEDLLLEHATPDQVKATLTWLNACADALERVTASGKPR
jgi:DNA-binding MarR family transcriptional regulator